MATIYVRRSAVSYIDANAVWICDRDAAIEIKIENDKFKRNGRDLALIAI